MAVTLTIEFYRDAVVLFCQRQTRLLVLWSPKLPIAAVPGTSSVSGGALLVIDQGQKGLRCSVIVFIWLIRPSPFEFFAHVVLHSTYP